MVQYAHDTMDRVTNIAWRTRSGALLGGFSYEYDALGRITSRHHALGGASFDRTYSYDGLDHLAADGDVAYTYDAKGRVSRQTVDGTPIDYTYTKYGQLAGKYLGGREKPDAAVEYEYSKSGKLVARTANGVRQTYEYDGRGQLLAVKNADGSDAERYAYDKAGNMVRKTVGGKTTTFTFDGANQLVSSTTDGVTTKYAYDAAGRLVKEGSKTYRYGYLDKVLSVTDGKSKYTYDYHVDGQLASASYGDGKSEDFLWDGLALIQRGGERFINEPHVGGGNPVVSSKGTSYFSDMLGTTLGAKAKGKKYSAAALTAFGEDLTIHSPTPTSRSNFFTGKPCVAGLGHVFLFRNYRASLGKWLTADPLGYPDGWNALAYGINSPSTGFDKAGGSWSRWDDEDFTSYYFTSYRIYGDGFDTDNMGLTGEIFAVINDVVLTRVEDQIDAQVASLVAAAGGTSGGGSFRKGTSNSYSFGGVCFSLGDGSVQTSSQVTYSWFEMSYNNIRYRYYEWSATIWVNYSDIFKDPLDIGIEIPGGQAYYYYHTWTNIHRSGFGIVVLE